MINESHQRRLGVGSQIGKWRKRFIADRIKGFMVRCAPAGPARSRTWRRVELITKTLACKPNAATHWSVRDIANNSDATPRVKGSRGCARWKGCLCRGSLVASSSSSQIDCKEEPIP